MAEGLKDRVKQARRSAAGNNEPPNGGGGKDLVAVKEIITQLRQMRNEFAVALPKGVEPEQLIRDAVSEIRRNPDLLREDVDPATILGAVMTCAQLGLRPGVMGQAWVLPFWNTQRGRREATFVVGYRGLAKLAHQSRLVRGLAARTVFERDEFDFYSAHDGDRMVHRPYLTGDRGKPVLYYARGLLADGGYQLTEPANHADMLEHRDRFVKTSGGPWFDDRGVPHCGFEAMAWKTEVKRLAKLLPLSTHFGWAVDADEGVRYDASPRADVAKSTEHPGRDIDGEFRETGGPDLDWSDVADAAPRPTPAGPAAAEGGAKG